MERRSLKKQSLGVIINHKHKHDYVCNHRCNYNYTHTIVLVLVQGVQEVCRECRGVQGCAGGVQAATHGVLASVQRGVQKVQVPCTPCTDGSIISGAEECRE